MNLMRNRAKEYFPTVLLTLLSIVQALALEFLWSHVLESQYLFEATWLAMISWLQLLATLLGLVLIWVFYASNTMRFRWVPHTSDSIYPFAIGLLEFMLIECLGPDRIGLWLMVLAIVFAVMVRVSHTTMKRARADGDNDSFFQEFEPAVLADFYLHIAAVSIMLLLGVCVYLSANTGIVATFGILIALAILAWQFRITALSWNQSVAEE